MADSDSGWALLLIIPAIILMVAAAIIAVALTLSAGSLFGAGTALYNYAKAFREKVQPERA